MIVIDGPNVARKHGKDTVFSSEGIKIAIDYYLKKGHDVVVFVPEQYTKKKPSNTLGAYFPVASNIPLLLDLVDKGYLILTPAADYDDNYTIEYAKKNKACILTNDRYNDYIEKQKDKDHARRWIRSHSISFTFVRDELLPNPDFVFR